MKKTVTLTFSDGSPSIELPIEEGTYGKPVIDIRALGAHGYFSHDPGFTATSSCTSAITYIDGEQGLLYYRGYPIEELAYQSDYMEVSYLLLHGELPTPEQKVAFEQSIRHHTLLHDQIENVFRGFRRSAHPMAVMIGVTGAMSAFYHRGLDNFNPEHRVIVAHRLIAKVPTVAAWAYKFNEGQPFVYPQNRLDYAENFMHMMFSSPCEPYEPNPVLARARSHLHPARRSRTECLDLDRAPGGFQRRQSLRVHRERHGLAMGAAARRRQRGSIANAGRDRRRRQDPGVHQSCQGQVGFLPPDGFRPSHLQEHGSARRNHPPDLLRSAGRARSARRSAVQDRA